MKASRPVREASCAAVWAPWLAAPLFALLPLGGCGLAGLARPAAARTSTVRQATVAAAAPGMPSVARHAPRGG